METRGRTWEIWSFDEDYKKLCVRSGTFRSTKWLQGTSESVKALVKRMIGIQRCQSDVRDVWALSYPEDGNRQGKSVSCSDKCKSSRSIRLGVKWADFYSAHCFPSIYGLLHLPTHKPLFLLWRVLPRHVAFGVPLESEPCWKLQILCS